MSRKRSIAGLAALALVVLALLPAAPAPAQTPTGELLDAFVVPFGSDRNHTSDITLQAGTPYTLVVTGSGTMSYDDGTSIKCDAMYCLASDTATPLERGNLKISRGSVSYYALDQATAPYGVDVPYDASHTYTVEFSRDVAAAAQLVAYSSPGIYGCQYDTRDFQCSGSFIVNIYGPPGDEVPFKVLAVAKHPATIRSPLGEFVRWNIHAIGGGLQKNRLAVSYVEPEWDEFGGRGTQVFLSVDKMKHMKLPAASTLNLDVTVIEQTQFPSSPEYPPPNLPDCPVGTRGTVLLIDFDHVIAGGEKKRGQTSDEVFVKIPDCSFLSHHITNADSLEHDPFVGGAKGKPEGGQHVDVRIGKKAASPGGSGGTVKTPAEALTIVEEVIAAAADECEITSWSIQVRGVRGLWKITAEVTMAGAQQTAEWSIVGKKLKARNAAAKEILNRCL